jgi:hypothetical protein
VLRHFLQMKAAADRELIGRWEAPAAAAVAAAELEEDQDTTITSG